MNATVDFDAIVLGAGAAAEAMRRTLIDPARRKKAIKRDGGQRLGGEKGDAARYCRNELRPFFFPKIRVKRNASVMIEP